MTALTTGETRFGEIQPRPGPLYAVRWIRADGWAVKHRYYRRLHDARAFASKLDAGGWQVEVYVQPTTRWRRVSIVPMKEPTAGYAAPIKMKESNA